MRRAWYMGALVLALSACERDAVRGAGPTAPEEAVATVSFAEVVVPALQVCTTCHIGGAGGWTYDGGAQAYEQVLLQVDLDEPAQSPLLRRGANQEAHGGGEQLAADGQAYADVLKWIEEGARDN